MALEPFLGEVRAVSFSFAPRGWAFCTGQLMAINQNQALFSILGITYGGDGISTFALPNLQGKVPLHVGGAIPLGQSAGQAAVILNHSQIGHSHSVSANKTADAFGAAGNYPASAPSGVLFGSTVDTTMTAGVVAQAGGSQAHNNLQPYLVVNYIIALRGIFPSRN
jgi:microcystin-dependent protein